MKTLLMSIVLGLLLIGCGVQESGGSDTADHEAAPKAEEGKQIVLRLSEAQVDDYPDSIAEKAFAEMVEERTNGRIKVEVYTGGQLGDEITTIEQTQVGIIDIGRANAGPLTQFASQFGIFSFPFLFDDRDHMWRSLHGAVGNKLFENLEKADLIGLAFYDAGARSFYTKKPIQTIEDIQGMKIRVMQNDLLIEAFSQLGVSPTPMSASEVYSGLQMGVIDGGENNVSTYVADGHFEVAENFTLSEHLRIPGVLFMSKKAWNQLSSEDQEMIAQAAKDSEKIQLEEYDLFAQKATERAEENGNNIVTLSTEDREEFRDRVQPIFEKYNDTFGEFFSEIENAR
jgi:tripartite ATP-independent transporter DctP family solute receptor